MATTANYPNGAGTKGYRNFSFGQWFKLHLIDLITMAAMGGGYYSRYGGYRVLISLI
jgi:hypothetical protein